MLASPHIAADLQSRLATPGTAPPPESSLVLEAEERMHGHGLLPVPEVVLVAGEVAVVVVVRGAGVVKEVVMELVGIDGGIGVDAQMLKCFSTVPLGPQYSQ
jgi:hypothetical protein